MVTTTTMLVAPGGVLEGQVGAAPTLDPQLAALLPLAWIVAALVVIRHLTTPTRPSRRPSFAAFAGGAPRTPEPSKS